MPSGDAQRAWFPEMLEELQQYWSAGVSWDDLVTFCSRMTAVRAKLRQDRGIKSPMMTCRDCGERSRSELPDISPRSALFALRKVGTIADEEMKALDRQWANHRKENGLDAYGKKVDS